MTKLAAAVATTLLLTVAAAAPASAENAGGPAPVPSGEIPMADGQVPADSNPATYGPTCVRIDLLPNYPGYLVLDYAWATVIMSDGVNSNIYYNAQVGDTLYTPSGNSLIWVVKCGLGGNGNYTKGDVNVIATPITVPSGNDDDVVFRKISFSIDGCQPGSTATVSVAGGTPQQFVVPPSGYLTGYLVIDPSLPDPATFTASCNKYEITVPLDDRSLDLVLGADGDAGTGGGTTTPADGGTVVEPADGSNDTPAVPTTVSAEQTALVAAAATDGASSITMASDPGRSFALADIDLTNPAAIESMVTAIAGADGSVDYVVAGAPVVGDIAAAAASDAAGSLGSSLPLARMALGGIAALGMVAFALRRRTSRATVKIPV